jgi:hypothetical protein
MGLPGGVAGDQYPDDYASHCRVSPRIVLSEAHSGLTTPRSADDDPIRLFHSPNP